MSFTVTTPEEIGKIIVAAREGEISFEEVGIEEFVDDKFVEELNDFNQRFDDLNEDELRQMNLIQSYLLDQLGLYDVEEDNRDNSPIMVRIIS